MALTSHVTQIRQNVDTRRVCPRPRPRRILQTHQKAINEAKDATKIQEPTYRNVNVTMMTNETMREEVNTIETTDTTTIEIEDGETTDVIDGGNFNILRFVLRS